MSKESKMVLAEKYELQVKIPGGDGDYDKKGQKKLVGKKKFIERDYAIQRNKAPNNEYFLFHEKETIELYKVREENVKQNALNKKKEAVGINDLIDVVVGNVQKQVPEELTELEMLKKMCDKKGLKYNNFATEKSLMNLLNENES